MPFLSALSTATTSINAFSKLILVTPNANLGYQPENLRSIADDTVDDVSEGFDVPSILFHYEGEQSVTLESDITDHYIEDNTAVQDQIALKPETVTTAGFIGELNDIAPGPLAALKFITDKLGAVTAFAPALTAGAQFAYQQALFGYQIGQRAVASAYSLTSLFSDKETQNKQQQCYQQFYTYWRERRLFTVQTPWAVHKNMAIKSLRAIQDAETNVISTFEVTFKQIRVATSQVVSAADFQKRAKAQAAAKVNQGTTAGTPSTISSAAARVASVGE